MLTTQSAVPITVSLGVCVLAQPEEPGPKGALLRDMIEQADRALYGAKGQGRNRVCITPYVAPLREGRSLLGPRPEGNGH